MCSVTLGDTISTRRTRIALLYPANLHDLAGNEHTVPQQGQSAPRSLWRQRTRNCRNTGGLAC
jgi:hypothetical protein